jgi:hypothetical protein
MRNENIKSFKQLYEDHNKNITRTKKVLFCCQNSPQQILLRFQKFNNGNFTFQQLSNDQTLIFFKMGL